jgi:adenylate cyclase class 2
MPYEVELKFSLDDADRILAQLDGLQAEWGSPTKQVDRYFNHPSRDFAQTDEALRIRTMKDCSLLTYKGPLLDTETKTRLEIELPVGVDAADTPRLADLLRNLGFHEVRAVHKTRTPFRLRWEERDLELSLDDVTDLGLFFEIETLTQEPDLDAARQSVLRLAVKLELENSQQKSYLQLLLEQDNAG